MSTVSTITEPGQEYPARARKNLLLDAWLVLFLAITFGTALAFVHVKLSPIVQANIRNETLSLIPVLVGDPETFDIQELSHVTPSGESISFFHVTDKEAKGLGWVITASNIGFADRIQLLVGLDESASQILGIRVVDQKETPGLGNKISDPEFRDQFEGAPTAKPLTIVKSAPAQDHQIRAVTGATISSVTVANAVNQAVINLKSYLESNPS